MTTAANLTATQIAEKINADGGMYYRDKARGWEGTGLGRVYFGKDYVTVEYAADGSITRIHADKAGKARAQTIGYSAVEMVQQAAAALTA